MARTRNPTAHAVRRDEILDAAERQIRAVGYDAMSVQALQDELGVSRGAIYHYFDSKEAILAAVIERTTRFGLTVLEPIAHDPDMPATVKLQALFSTGSQWKAQRSDLLLGLMRSWYAPSNDLVRARSQAASLVMISPLLARIIRQGVAEGTMNPSAPDHAATLITSLFTGSADVLFDLVQARLDERIPLAEVEDFIHAYEEAIERILGLRAGSFTLISPESLRTWFA